MTTNNPKPLSMAEMVEVAQQIKATTGWPLSAQEPNPFALPVEDAFIVHPETARLLSLDFREQAADNGIPVRESPFVPLGEILGMGSAASLMKQFKEKMKSKP